MSTVTSSKQFSAESPTSNHNSVLESKLQIFLGGSCNPTTWRQSVAIPYLEMNGISYYNPQVDKWSPEVVDLERYAKQHAQTLLFVIDKQTRSTVSLIESAYIAGDEKNLVLVIYPFEYNVITHTDTSKHTSNTIETRKRFMTKSYDVFNNHIASTSIIKSLSSLSSSSSSTLVSSSGSKETSLTATSAVAATRNLTKAINNSGGESTCELDNSSLQKFRGEMKQACGTIRINDEMISPKEFHELQMARCILHNLVLIQNIPLFSDILQALQFVSGNLDYGFEQKDASMHTEYTQTSTDSRKRHQRKKELSSLICSRIKKPDHDDITQDIYISLDCDDHSSVKSSVISLLKEKGLTYNCMSVNNIAKPESTTAISTQSNEACSKTSICPQLSSSTSNELSNQVTNEGLTTKIAIEREICAIKSSRVLLFVITNSCRGLSIMVLASHFMALFRDNVVLCIQYLEEPCSIAGESLSQAAIADYNRGRVYLCDYAVKSQVPVFNTIREAIECCSNKCRFNNIV